MQWEKNHLSIFACGIKYHIAADWPLSSVIECAKTLTWQADSIRASTYIRLTRYIQHCWASTHMQVIHPSPCNPPLGSRPRWEQMPWKEVFIQACGEKRRINTTRENRRYVLIKALRKYVGMARLLGNLKVTGQPIKLTTKVSTREAPHLRKISLMIV